MRRYFRAGVSLFAAMGASGCYHASVVSQSTYAPTYVTQQVTTTSVTVNATVATPVAAPQGDDGPVTAADENENTTWRPAVRLLTPMSLGYSPVDLNQCLRSPCQNPYGGCRCVYPGQPLPRALHASW